MAGIEPYASNLKAPPDAPLRIWRAEDINVVVVGGETQPAFRMIGASYRGGTVSVDAWR